MSMMDAQKSCAEKGSTLFVANSVEEFVSETIKETRTSTFKCLPLDDGKQPSWGSYDGVDPSQLKWLVNPYSSTVNGWTPLSTCVGHYNGDIYSDYLYFYPCSSLFHSVCERNSTLN
ncbi:unnamed protein product [Angiostrongylus costaricensis]|uniref:C-type lectin domain-containing protein n=1 Tax=Angiostrongylus costaricensis TaxID=334426 RepID=A0A0R3Q186_ANGCS|nr:unnamed protein product [Angiostrongylus costaricensis]